MEGAISLSSTIASDGSYSLTVTFDVGTDLNTSLAMVGVLLALFIRGLENDLSAQVGLVLMIALASKNAILIVEFARDLHARGCPSPRPRWKRRGAASVPSS